MIALVASLLLAASAPALQSSKSLGENWSPSAEGVHKERQAGRIIPFSQAVKTVEARFPGHLLDAGLESDDNGRQVYRVRWASADGRRLDVIVDAGTGAVLRQEGK